MKGKGSLYGIFIKLLKALLLTLTTGLIGFYSPSESYHYVKNGLPLPFVVQVINIKAAEYVEIRFEFLLLVLDVLIWTGFIFLLGFFRGILKGILSSKVK